MNLWLLLAFVCMTLAIGNIKRLNNKTFEWAVLMWLLGGIVLSGLYSVGYYMGHQKVPPSTSSSSVASSDTALA